MNPPLEFKACAGFGNRLRALVSAMCAAEDIVPLNEDGSRPLSLVVSWTPETDIHTAPFDFIFDMKTLPSWIKVEDSRLPPHSGWDNCKQVLSQEEWDFVLLRAGQNRPIRIKSHGHFYRNDSERWLRHLKSLKPNDMVSCMIEDIFSLTPSDTSQIIGVHIRRGDNEKSTNESPSELFWTAMKKYSLTTIFYLATDSIEVRYEAIERFPNRILFASDNVLSRNDPLGCRDAVVDFFCLSNCSEIIGSYYSSFSEMAAMYGDVPLRVLRLLNN
jgi:hypothetical protein